jgi:hypothetical protein
MNIVEVVTNPCVVCKESSLVPVVEADYLRWQVEGMLVQQAFPEMPVDQRELLVTGTHPKCWDAMWAEGDE